MENPLISVIVPIYNVEFFLEETLQSIVNQSYKNWELILVDDGSTDNSVLVAEKFTENPKIKLIKQENQGVSIARNNGLLSAKGDYIFFMDSDDTIDENFLKTAMQEAQKNDWDITILGDYFLKKFEEKSRVSALPTCAMFLKKRFLEKYPDIRFPEKIQPCEDGLFSHQLLALTEKIGFNPNGIYHYRRHENQNTANLNYDIILEKIPKWFEILESFYQKHNLIDKKYLHLLRFIQHEPFGARYYRTNLNSTQKKQLFDLIHYFCQKHIFPLLSKSEKKDFHPIFVKFLESKNHQDFDVFLENYLLKMEKWRKNRIKWTKFLFSGKRQDRKIHRINKFFEKHLDL